MDDSAKAYFSKGPTSKNQSKILRELGRFLKGDQISVGLSDCLSYGRDSNAKAILRVRHNQVKYIPEIVLWPKDRTQVSKILKLAHEKEMPVVPFGGGSGVCGGTWPLQGGIILDLKRMDQILQIDARKMQVRVQSGINGELLERALNRKGLTLGHFPSSIYSATLGGYLACRSAGQYSSLYGKIEDMVEGMEVVLADGQILKIDGVKNSPQTLDLKEVFLGSEGTLGILTEATLRIHPLPEEEEWIAFNFSNLQKGIRAIREMMQRGLTPALVRLYDPLDSILATSYAAQENKFPLNFFSEIFKPAFRRAKDLTLKLILKNASLANNLSEILPAHCLLILGFRGLKMQVEGQVERAKKICQSFKGKDLGEKPGQEWLKHRYSVNYKLSPIFDEGFFADTMEVATTWSRLIPLYGAIREAMAPKALVMAHLSHAYSEGCSIYFTFLSQGEDLKESEDRYDEIWNRALRACVRAGGTISHHHGVGVLKGAFMKEEWGEAYHWLCKLKKALDPKGILNPGKLGFPLNT